MVAEEEDKHLKRRLAVILASDVEGYSRLIAVDEEGTIRRFGKISRIVHDLVKSHGGRVFNTAGDAILAEFDSAVNAVRASLDVHEAIASAEDRVVVDRKLVLRIGIAMGDVVVVQNGDLLGDGVNVAARLQQLAEPGGTCVSREVQQLVANRVGVGFRDLGTRDLKNIAQPVHVFSIALRAPSMDALSLQSTDGQLHSSKRYRTTLLPAGLTLVAIGLVVVLGWRIGLRPIEPIASIGRPDIFDATRVPLISEEARLRLVPAYSKAKGPKALAISNDGDFHGIAVNASDEAAAMERARETCERDSTAAHKRPCFVYAAGERVLADPKRFPMPLAEEIVRAPSGQLFGVADTPLTAMQQGRRLKAEYPNEKRPKAMAIGTRGEATWGAMSTGETVDEAVRRALEFCGFRTPGACILYAVGDDLMTKPPQSRRIIGVLSFSGDRVIPAAERPRLLAIYRAGGDWQALSTGSNGTWHAVAGSASETSAIDEAMAHCRQADRECRIYAIGRFLVGSN